MIDGRCIAVPISHPISVYSIVLFLFFGSYSFSEYHPLTSGRQGQVKDIFRCLNFLIYLSRGTGFSVVTWKLASQREPEKVAPGTGLISIMCRDLVNLYIQSMYYGSENSSSSSPREKTGGGYWEAVFQLRNLLMVRVAR